MIVAIGGHVVDDSILPYSPNTFVPRTVSYTPTLESELLEFNLQCTGDASGYVEENLYLDDITLTATNCVTTNGSTIPTPTPNCGLFPFQAVNNPSFEESDQNGAYLYLWTISGGGNIQNSFKAYDGTNTAYEKT